MAFWRLLNLSRFPRFDAGGSMRIAALIAFFFLLSSSVFAAQEGFQEQGVHTGGFQGPLASPSITTVKQALNSPDDSPVILTGHILRREAGDHEQYLFRDATGDIVVEIDDMLFRERTVTPKTTIRIYGEVDREISKPTKIDVKRFDIQ